MTGKKKFERTRNAAAEKASRNLVRSSKLAIPVSLICVRRNA
jgi:hypothetical protein